MLSEKEMYEGWCKKEKNPFIVFCFDTVTSFAFCPSLLLCPLMHLVCTLPESEYHFAPIAVPATVEGLTVSDRGNEILICWEKSVGVVSYYIVYVTIDGKEKLQLNSSTNELMYQSEALRGYGTIEVQVHAANNAGIGPSATITIFGNKTQKEEQGINNTCME